MSDFTACKDCINRYPGCHGKCAEYLAEKAIHDAEVESVRMVKNNSISCTERRKQNDTNLLRHTIKRMGGHCK